MAEENIVNLLISCGVVNSDKGNAYCVVIHFGMHPINPEEQVDTEQIKNVIRPIILLLQNEQLFISYTKLSPTQYMIHVNGCLSDVSAVMQPFTHPGCRIVLQTRKPRIFTITEPTPSTQPPSTPSTPSSTPSRQSSTQSSTPSRQSSTQSTASTPSSTQSTPPSSRQSSASTPSSSRQSTPPSSRQSSSRQSSASTPSSSRQSTPSSSRQSTPPSSQQSTPPSSRQSSASTPPSTPPPSTNKRSRAVAASHTLGMSTVSKRYKKITSSDAA